MPFFPDHMLVKYASIDGVPQAFLSFRFVDIMVITVHDRFWNVGDKLSLSSQFENFSESKIRSN
jgi:hypothetical protein